MAAEFLSSARATQVATSIYEISKETLMAHSIRAVEKYLRDTYRFETKIVLEMDKSVLSDTGRMSWCSVAANSGDPTFIFIQDDPEWDKSRKRFCIAHELYHVIWSVASPADTPRTKLAEQTCDLFANDLCGKHHAFYSDQANINKILFQGLPYRSV